MLSIFFNFIFLLQPNFTLDVSLYAFGQAIATCCYGSDSTVLHLFSLSRLIYRVQTAKTKNVFVVYCGDENSATIRKGVRYISVSDSKDGGDVKNTVENMKYLSFNVTQNNITYCFRNLYNTNSSKPENGGMVLE